MKAHQWEPLTLTQHLPEPKLAPFRFVRLYWNLVLAIVLLAIPLELASAAPASSSSSFEVSFSRAEHRGPITGRLFLILSRVNEPEVRLQTGWLNTPPIFGVDVSNWRPDAKTIIDARTPGFPVDSLGKIPAGEYYVQALLNVYTEFRRADGHTIWAHMDQWEGQHFNKSPGNLISSVTKIYLNGARSSKISLQLSETIPPIKVPQDTDWVKHIKIQSKLLSSFWGRPIYLGAVVLLPDGYSSHPDTKYPVTYVQGHFDQNAAFEFTIDQTSQSNDDRQVRETRGIETGYEFYQAWKSAQFPRMLAVTFLHPTPFFDDSHAVNSANVGPYGDAIMTELIPYIEEHFRIVRQPYARALTGGSTGGWEALALQLHHPEFFGSTWVFYPDPIDFRRYGLINIYVDENAFLANARSEPEEIFQRTLSGPVPPERSLIRSDTGQQMYTVRQLSQLESVLGSKGRSGEQFAMYEATYGPLGVDGYPRPLWNSSTGKIDRVVATYMREHGYDLRFYLEQNWGDIAPKLVDKLHFYCGDMDNFYLNLGVYEMEKFLHSMKKPYLEGSFEFGRPLKGHGWQPMSNAMLLKMIAKHIQDHAPAYSPGTSSE